MGALNVLRLGGATCSGKTTLLRLLEEGHDLLADAELSGLLCGRSLSVAVAASFVEAAAKGEAHADFAARTLAERKKQVLCIEEELAGRDFVLDEDGMSVCAVQLVLPEYLWEARRQWRFARGYTTTPSWARVGNVPASYRLHSARALEAELTVKFLDVSDCPARIVSREQAARVFAGRTRESDAEAPRLTYHGAVRAGDEWFGDPAHREAIQRRFDHYFDGEKLQGAAVLDLGCAEGAFSLEAARRGAAMVFAIDVRPERLATLQALREVARLPVTTVCLSFRDGPPLPNFVGRGGGRYGLTLMLNVLRHLRDPEKALREALKVSNRLLLETIVGAETQLGSPPQQAFSHEWVAGIAAEEGFDCERRQAGLQPEQRALWVMQRKPVD